MRSFKIIVRNATASLWRVQKKAPPLLHVYYVPSHHGDAAIIHAIQRGTKQHHWNFGDMKPVAGIAENEERAIVEYIRWYQREKGLY